MKNYKVIERTDEFLVGDWIIVKDGDYTYKGFVSFIRSRYTFDMFCLGYYNDEGHFRTKNKVYKNMKTDNVYLDNNITLDEIEDKRHLIDLTLRTWDEDWFNNLVNQ
jgi:hypothetical protein